MSVFKSLIDKVQQKKEELEQEAAKKAARKAAEMAVERGKEVALAAVEQAGRTLRSAGASIEEALFGPESEAEHDDDAAAPGPRAGKAGSDRPPSAGPAAAREPQRAMDQERFEREVDEELAALKRKLAGR